MARYRAPRRPSGPPPPLPVTTFVPYQPRPAHSDNGGASFRRLAPPRRTSASFPPPPLVVRPPHPPPAQLHPPLVGRHLSNLLFGFGGVRGNPFPSLLVLASGFRCIMQRKIAGRCGNRLPECRMAMSIIVAHGVAGDEIINEAAESSLDLRAARVARAQIMRV